MRHLFRTALLIFTTLSFAQNIQQDPLTAFGRSNLGLHGLEFTYELPVSNSLVWENSVGVGMGSRSYYNGNGIDYTFYLNSPTPYITSELKYLYNREKRIRKGRSTMNNSGNYIGLQTKYSFGDETTYELNRTLLTELHWGIQRPLGKKFIFDMHLGLGYLSDFDFKAGSISPTFGLRFGYILF